MQKQIELKGKKIKGLIFIKKKTNPFTKNKTALKKKNGKNKKTNLPRAYNLELLIIK